MKDGRVTGSGLCISSCLVILKVRPTQCIETWCNGMDQMHGHIQQVMRNWYLFGLVVVQRVAIQSSSVKNTVFGGRIYIGHKGSQTISECCSGVLCSLLWHKGHKVSTSQAKWVKLAYITPPQRLSSSDAAPQKDCNRLLCCGIIKVPAVIP